MKPEADAYCKEMNENAYLFNLKSFVSSVSEAQLPSTLFADLRNSSRNERNERGSGDEKTNKIHYLPVDISEREDNYHMLNRVHVVFKVPYI